MGPIIVIGIGVLAALWTMGLLTPRRIRTFTAITIALVALRVLAMGRPLVAAGLLTLAAWIYWTSRSGPTEQLVEARRLLGVGKDADAAEINAAYRARMAALHPDKGGSDAEAGAVNAARDTLLQHMARRRR